MAMKPAYRVLTAFIISSTISLILYLINLILGNPPNDLEIIIISLVIFIDIFLGFIAYWLIRNLFSKRWAILDQASYARTFRLPISNFYKSELHESEKNQLKDILNKERSSFSNPVTNRYTSLFAEIVFPVKEDKNILVFYCHGFNDNSQNIRYKTYALAELGYTILAWDARGMGNSSRVGKKGEFLSRSEDALVIVEFFRTLPEFRGYQFVIIGESMGGISAAYVMHHIPNSLQKCILISTPAIFNQTFERHLVFLSRKWIQRLNYRLKGINPYPAEELNKKLSPYLLFQDLRNHYPEREWRTYTNSHFLLIHSMTDKLISVENCTQNREILNLSDKNLVLFETGNHNQIKNEIGIISAIDSFLKIL